MLTCMGARKESNIEEKHLGTGGNKIEHARKERALQKLTAEEGSTRILGSEVTMVGPEAMQATVHQQQQLAPAPAPAVE